MIVEINCINGLTHFCKFRYNVTKMDEAIKIFLDENIIERKQNFKITAKTV